MQNRRKTVVINKKFQHHYALLFVACTIFLVNLIIVLNVVWPDSDPINLTMGIASTIAVVEMALLVGVWFGTIRITHHIAGPVYVFTRDIDRFAAGEYSARIRLREHDMFQEEASKINASLDKLEQSLRTGGAQ
ncbi:MAG: hypothetical protein ABJL54_08945 [Halioglobus sp.]